jgi:O-antigen/teichoic acid export membrane protein
MVSGPPAAAPAVPVATRASSVASGIAWALGAHATAALGLLAGFRLLTERLPPAAFGELSLLVALASFARALAGFPVLQAALRHFPESAAAGSSRVFVAVMRHELLRSAGLAVALTLAAGLVARTAFQMSLLPFLLLGAFLAADLGRNFLLDVLNASGQHARYAAWVAAEAWARPMLGVLGAVLLGATAAGVLAGYVVAALALALLVASVSPLRGAARWSGDEADGQTARAELRGSMRSFARPLVPLALFAWLTSVGDRYLLAAFSGAAQVGVYAATYGLVNVAFVGAQGVLELALRPAYFAAASAGDRALERRLFALWISLSITVAGAGVGLLWALHEPLAALALGPAYRAAAPLMRTVALGLGLWLVSAAVEKACYARKRTRGVLAAQAVGAGAFLLITPPLVQRFGAAGAAAAVPVYFGLQLAASVVAARAAMRAAR